jgi:hypothetical protein
MWTGIGWIMMLIGVWWAENKIKNLESRVEDLEDRLDDDEPYLP